MKRQLIAVFAVAAFFVGCAKPPSGGESKQAEVTGMYTITVHDLDGNEKSLADYEGKVVLMVNVASKCGYTPQYTGLEALYQSLQGKDFVLIGVPSNDFGAQEPGTAQEIKLFCTSNYNVTFPMLEKMPVKNGPEQCELYQYLTHKDQNGMLDAQISWNFNKILIGKNGVPIKHYESKVTPDDPGLRADIEAALAA